MQKNYNFYENKISNLQKALVSNHNPAERAKITDKLNEVKREMYNFGLEEKEKKPVTVIDAPSVADKTEERLNELVKITNCGDHFRLNL